MDKYMTIREVARTGFLPEYRLRELVAQGSCPGIYAGKKFLINYTLLNEMMRELCVKDMKTSGKD